MGDRHNVEAKLAIVDEWVRTEFLAASEAMESVQTTSTDESGPGRHFRQGRRTIVRLHPKQHHLAVGLPMALRADVEALTGALRAQQDASWFNYTPQTCDRETLEALLDKSLQLSTAVKNQPSGTTGEAGVAQDSDEADLTLILAVLNAFREHERATGKPSTVKVVREAIFFRWEAPRLPAGGKYSSQLPHSPAARQRRAAGAPGGLVYEHVIPISLVIRSLLANPPATTAALRSILEASADRVIITKEEDQAMTAAGARNATPMANDPWSRYRAAGLDPQNFHPFA